MAMPGDILADESLRRRLEEFLAKPKGICIDENTHRRLGELCSQMASVYGLVQCVLQLALTKEGEERTAYIKTALDISRLQRMTRQDKLGTNAIFSSAASLEVRGFHLLWRRLL